MPNGAEHEPGNHWGTLLAIGTGLASLWRAISARRPKEKEPDPEEEFDAAVNRGSRRAVILAQLDESEIRMERLTIGQSRNEAGIDRIERALVQMKQELLGELDAMQRHLRREIDERCSGAKPHKPE